MIPYGRQDISEEDIKAVIDVLRSDMLTTGPQIPLFESHLCDYTGAVYACAMNSATSALHIACLALGLGEGDVLWTSPFSFVASSNCALYCGASVDFVDITPDTYLMDIDVLEAKLEKAKKTNSLPKIVVPVHFAGQSCDMRRIKSLSGEYGFHIIEDAAHAVGGSYQGAPVGSCQYSDITVFSFHPVKIITTGEGGVALTNKPELAEAMSVLRSHGLKRDFEDKPDDEPWRYSQEMLGYNYRMTDIAAALGISQLSRLGDFVAKRHELAAYYDEKLANFPLALPQQNTASRSALHLYPVRVQSKDIDRKSVFKQLRDRDIGVQVHYQPIHTQDYYQKLGFASSDFPVAMSVYEQIFSLPLYPTLTHTEQDKVIKALGEIFNG